ncbi:mitochondrial import inner membrane translocase subunit TIM50-C-like [Anoplophora glabripennis]|uniref:mitochondrial import inner membrane translocase subunit TIM50-C-like n=1 Tax=Anoplophora glabripennis TaxID=217634 RepID=UPI0008742268|nr:mitochondrial import inner membrane translocase subunit TIM50-C-like [Anoplophora glabripennis]
MAPYVLFGTLPKILRQSFVVQQTVKPLGIYHNALYSNFTKNNLPPSDNEYGENSKKGKSWKILKTILPILAISITSSLAISLVLTLGAPEIDTDGKLLKDDFSDEPELRQYLKRTYREMKYYFKLLERPRMEKLLPDPLDHPYNQPKYTLVVELTDVLVHAEWTYSVGWRYKKRPLLEHFLEDLKDSYEIVLFTTEHGRTVFSLIDVIDPNNRIAFKLVGGATRFTGLSHVKELNKLNRDLKKVICIDWNAKRLKYNPENLLKVKRWIGNDDDTSLLDLAAFLKIITSSQIEDVRDVLKYYSKYNDPVEAFRRKQEMLIEELEKAAAKKGDRRRTQSGFKLFS